MTTNIGHNNIMSEDFEDSHEITLNPDNFVKAILLFPCFKEADPRMPAAKLFDIIIDAYRLDNLTEEQDLAVELVLHLHDESTPFNLKRAREIWANEDKEVLIGLLAADITND